MNTPTIRTGMTVLSFSQNNPKAASAYYDTILSVIPDVPDNAILRAHMRCYAAIAKAQRYDGSNLKDEDKEHIAADIRKVLESPAVFSSDFSLSTLSEMVGRTPKAVSQVVNEVFSTNFSTLVNKIRIYEACRRIDSPEYSNWSVEGIAESVGYSQRNTFSSNFKKLTGMGIREYRRLSEQEKKDTINNGKV